SLGVSAAPHPPSLASNIVGSAGFHQSSHSSQLSTSLTTQNSHLDLPINFDGRNRSVAVSNQYLSGQHHHLPHPSTNYGNSVGNQSMQLSIHSSSSVSSTFSVGMPISYRKTNEHILAEHF